MYEPITKFDLQAERQSYVIEFLEARRLAPAYDVMCELKAKFQPAKGEIEDWLRAWMQRP